MLIRYFTLSLIIILCSCNESPNSNAKEEVNTKPVVEKRNPLKGFFIKNPTFIYLKRAEKNKQIKFELWRLHSYHYHDFYRKLNLFIERNQLGLLVVNQ